MTDAKFGMTQLRYEALVGNDDLNLKDEEEAAGWYFSTEYDGLLVNRHWEGHELTDEEWGQ